MFKKEPINNRGEQDTSESEDPEIESSQRNSPVSLKEDNVAVSAAVDSINQGLELLGVSPIEKKNQSTALFD